jgi:hypothetical protein
MNKIAAIVGTGLTLLTVLRTSAIASPNPLVVDLHRAQGSSREASATIFDTGSHLLINLTASRSVRMGAAVTLNAGMCERPGAIAFSLSRMSSNGSLTELRHSMPDLTSRAQSIEIHQTSSETSPVLACGSIANAIARK